MGQIEEMIKEEKYDNAIKIIDDSMQMEAWRENYGT